jgi:hypothetical protein
VAGGRAQQVGPRDLVDVVERVAELGHGLHVAGTSAPHVVYLRMPSVVKACVRLHKGCGSVTIWYGSGTGSADPYLWQTDPDSDPAPAPDAVSFLSDMQDANYLLLFEARFTAFFKDKKS